MIYSPTIMLLDANGTTKSNTTLIALWNEYKACLVILGNHQVEGVDFIKTFAPVAKMITIRAFLVVASAKLWELNQMDVHDAFLHGGLQEKVYIKMPLGFQVSFSKKVCRLRKSLYGFKQASQC